MIHICTVIIYIIIGLAILGWLFAFSLRHSVKYQPIGLRPHFTAELEVNFDDCYLLENSREKDAYQPNLMPPAASMLDPRLYDQVTHRYSYVTTIVFESNGIKYYGSIEKDNLTVRFYMMKQKLTKIFYDPKNPGHYFFDLRFMNE